MLTTDSSSECDASVSLTSLFRPIPIVLTLLSSSTNIESVYLYPPIPIVASIQFHAISLNESVYLFQTSAVSGISSHIRISDPLKPNLSFSSDSCFSCQIVLGASEYAILSEDELTVDTSMIMGPEFMNNILQSNPSLVFRPVNRTPALPYFDPLIQTIAQDGWLITDVDVQPAWKIWDQTPGQISDTSVLVPSDLQAYIDNWASLTTDNKDDVLKRLTKIVHIVLKRYKNSLTT